MAAQREQQDTGLSSASGGGRPSDDAPGADEVADDEMKREQMNLLPRRVSTDNLGEINAAPLFTWPVLQHAQRLATDMSSLSVTQYGLLAGGIENSQETLSEDPRIFYNVSAPSSTFICGSQGSGKSHTLSCILENCLVQSNRLGRLPRPLTGIVFHYDDHLSDSRVSPCEAAFLGSAAGVRVRVLCSPTNIRAVENSYNELVNVTVEALCLDQKDLNTKRMLELMAFDRAQPLYAQVIQRILRDMRRKQQDEPRDFNYAEFRSKLYSEQLSPDQKRGLGQRLDTLESFMVAGQVERQARSSKRGLQKGTNWEPKAGELIIIDLSCPCITASMACALFNICLSIFLGQASSLGRIVALDEAHKYMGESSDSAVFTDSLLSVIRQQRHQAARVVISTQEPTVSPKLLDLCSITIVHRFSSPDWLSVLTKHLAGISKVSRIAHRSGHADVGDDEEACLDGLRGLDVSPQDPILDLFSQIVELRTGEALVFAPSAIVSMQKQNAPQQEQKMTPRKLGHQVLRVVIRARITEDGGRSIMAS